MKTRLVTLATATVTLMAFAAPAFAGTALMS